MKPALLITASVAVNVTLLAATVARPDLAPRALRSVLTSSRANPDRTPATGTAADAKSKSPSAAAAKAGASTDSPAASASFAATHGSSLWDALDTDDLPVLVQRLRAAGFSRSVILVVLNAKLEARFAPRLKALTAGVADAPFWKPDPSMSLMGMPKYWEEYTQISRERSRMLRELLGRDSMAWGGTDPAVAQKRQFGDIPAHKIELIQRIADDYTEMTAQLRASMQGITLPEDREKFALLEREKRADLAAILTPQELEEYEMRTSPVTSRLRNTLSLMDASEAEFRALFKVQQAYNDRINPPVSGMISQQMMEERREAQRQMLEQVKTVLPANRFAEYQRASNTEYQQLHRLAQRDNIPMDTALRAFNLRDSTSAESVRIVEDAAMTPAQKRDALQALAKNARTQIIGTLGTTAGEAYAQTARWLQAAERGSGFTFNPDGTVSYKSIPPPPPPAK